MKKYLLLIIISFLISQSFEFEPKMKIEFKELRNLDESLDSSSWNGSNFDTELPDSSVEDQLTKEKKIKPTLLGFGVFQKKAEKANNITFNIYFKNVGKDSAVIFLKYLFFKIILKSKKNRILEEKENFEIERTLCAILNEDSLSQNIIEYNVNNDITYGYLTSDSNKEINVTNIDSIEVKPNFQFLPQDNLNDRSKDLLHTSLESGENAVYIMSREDLNNLQDQTGDSYNRVLFLNVYDLTQLGFLYYKIKGSFSQAVSLEKEKLNFTYTQYTEVKYFEGNLEKIPDLENNYTLTFKFKDFIDANLNKDCKADISQYKIPKKRRLEEEYFQYLMLSSDDQEMLHLDETSPEVSHNFGRKIASSSGLSGGAIAGIVIACVVALVGVALAFIYFNKPNIKQTDASAIEFYNSNSNVNSSIAVVQD